MAFLKCASCGQVYMSKAKLAEHISTRHSSDTPEVVQAVAKIIEIEPEVKKRRRYQKSSPAYQPVPSEKGRPLGCTFCRRRFLQIANLSQHIISHHIAQLQTLLADAKTEKPPPEPEPPKDDIDEDFDSIVGVSREKERQPKFQCPCCLRTYFMGGKSFFLHVERHIRETTDLVQCQWCPEKLRGTNLLKSHVKRQHCFKCPRCNAVFPFRRYLLNHVRNDHAFRCPEPNCGESFVFFSEMQRHKCFCDVQEVKVETNAGVPKLGQPKSFSWQCKWCTPKKMFESREAFVEHRKLIHRVFTCKFAKCFHSFHSEAELSSHECNLHTRKPFRCIRCLKSFLYRQQFTRHVRAKHRTAKRNLSTKLKTVGQANRSNLNAVANDSSCCQCCVKCEPEEIAL